MNEGRVEEFTREVAALKTSGAKGDTEKRLLALGSLLMLAGVVLAIIGGIQVAGTTNSADQVAAIATGGLLGLVLAVVGAALFLRYSIGRFMRFWAIRLIHEHQ
jgi:hypothetical protein